jgi:aldehyde:ferredoxin oxidoreductase
MSKYGYAGEILKVDLSDGKIKKQPSADYTDKFLGGQGIAARLYWEMAPPQAGAFDPENCFIAANGPLTGFPGFAGFRWKICGKAPRGDRETFSYANLGERWGAWLKYAGYDALAVQGKADKPAYLFINNDSVEIRDASHLWGQTTFDTMDILKAEHGKNVSVLTIGPAAEHLISYANVLAEGGASGSGGLGAVMGSKNLKAVVVAASNKRPVAADPARVKQLVARLKAGRQGHGMPSPWAVPGITKDHICYGCGIGCGRQMYTADKGRRYKSFCQATNTYIGSVMRLYGKFDDAQLLAIRLCDGYGLDSAVMQGQIEWINACYQEGLISEKSTGLPLSKMGTAEFIETLTRKISFREGFGDTLARGTIAAAASVGVKAQEMLPRFIATKSSETKDYDPRLMMTTALLYATEPRRPIQQLHEVSMMLMMWLGWASGGPMPAFSSDIFRNAASRYWGDAIAADFSTYDGKALAAKKIQDHTYVKESLVVCDLRWQMGMVFQPGAQAGDRRLESQILSAITGKETDDTELYKTGERIFNLQRAILLRQGWPGRKGDVLLDYFHTVPLQKGEIFFNPDGLAPGKDGEKISRLGAVVDRKEFERIKTEYYEHRGWDAESGLPKKAKLEELQLQDVAADLKGRGLLK